MSEYGYDMSAASAGDLVDTRPHLIESYAAESSIDFGKAVVPGTDPTKQVEVVNSATDKFWGVTVRDIAKMTGGFADEESVPVLRAGMIYVTVTHDVTMGDMAYVDVTNSDSTKRGYFTNVATGNLATGRYFMSSASSGDIAKLEFDARDNLAYEAGVDAITAAGSLDTDVKTSEITTTGATAYTLADGQEGQEKIIVLKVDGGDATVTPSHLAGYTTITLNDVGDSCLLKFVGGTWYVVANNGCTLA